MTAHFYSKLSYSAVVLRLWSIEKERLLVHNSFNKA